MEEKNVLILIAIVLAVLFLGSFGAGGMMGFGWMFMWVPLLLLLILLVLLLGRVGTSVLSSEQRGESALEALKLRYARGEISREEYLRMKGEIEE